MHCVLVLVRNSHLTACWYRVCHLFLPVNILFLLLLQGVIPLVKGAVEEDILLVPLVRLAWSCLIVACAVLIVTLDTTVMRIGSVRVCIYMVSHSVGRMFEFSKLYSAFDF